MKNKYAKLNYKIRRAISFSLIGLTAMTIYTITKENEIPVFEAQTITETKYIEVPVVKEIPMDRVTFEVTMYTDKDGMEPYGYTSNNTKTRKGIVAAPESIPYGHKVIFDQLPPNWEHLDRIYEVQDRGNDIVKKYDKAGDSVYCINIWTNSKEEAKQFGKKMIMGWILAPSNQNIQWD